MNLTTVQSDPSGRENVTAAAVPASALRSEISEEDIAAGITDAGYRVESAIDGCTSHFIDMDGEWKVLPGYVPEHMTIAQTRLYIRELQDALMAAQALEDQLAGAAT
jgi:hypothetical protein